MRRVTRRGQAGAPPVVFLHGGVINRFMWEPVIDHLEDRYDCIAVDLPAHGDRADQGFTVQSSVDVVTSTLDELAIERAAMVGLSLGGYIAQAVTTVDADRVNGIVLSGATIQYTGWDAITTRFYGYLFPILSQPAMKAFARKMTEDLGPEIGDKVIAGGLSARGGSQALRRLPGTDYAAALARSGYTGPIVLASGERDTPNREGETHFLELFPEAEAIVIEDAGHACALQQPAAYAQVVAGLMEMAGST